MTDSVRRVYAYDTNTIAYSDAIRLIISNLNWWHKIVGYFMLGLLRLYHEKELSDNMNPIDRCNQK